MLQESILDTRERNTFLTANGQDLQRKSTGVLHADRLDRGRPSVIATSGSSQMFTSASSLSLPTRMVPSARLSTPTAISGVSCHRDSLL
jgi:hypothetical protein